AVQAEARQGRKVPPERARARARAPGPGDDGCPAPCRRGQGGGPSPERRAPPSIRRGPRRVPAAPGAARPTRGGAPPVAPRPFARHRPLARKRIARESLLQEIPRALGRPEVELTVQTDTDDSAVATGIFDGEERKLNLSLFGSGEYARLLEVYAQIEPSDRPPF